MTKLTPTEIIYSNLNDILGLIINAKNFVSGMTLKDFLGDEKTIFAVSRCLQLISFKASFISRLTQRNRDLGRFNLPYRELDSLGRRLNHLYQPVNPQIIWRTIEADLDDLEFGVRRILGDRIKDSLPERIFKLPKIELDRTDGMFELTASTLSFEITPFIKAISDLQHTIDHIYNRPESIVRIQYIGQNSPVGISLEGVADALNVLISTVVPWRREHAKRMAELEEQHKQAQIEIGRAEVLDKRANALKQREETRKITVEIEEKRIDIALKVLQALPQQYSETERIVLVNQLLKPLEILTESKLLVTLPEAPRE